MYLGFKEIYLLGVDMNYLNQKSVTKEDKRDWIAKDDDDPNHFDPRYFGKGKKYHRPRIDDLVLPGYVNAKILQIVKMLIFIILHMEVS